MTRSKNCGTINNNVALFPPYLCHGEFHIFCSFLSVEANGMKHWGTTGILTWLKMKMLPSFFSTSEPKLEQLVQYRFDLICYISLTWFSLHSYCLSRDKSKHINQNRISGTVQPSLAVTYARGAVCIFIIWNPINLTGREFPHSTIEFGRTLAIR